DELGLSITELSKKLKMNASTILRYEQGSINPPPDKLKIMSEIFDCSIDYILYLTDEKKVEPKQYHNNLKRLLEANPETKNIFIERIKDFMIHNEVTKEQLSNLLQLDKNLIHKFIIGEEFPNIDILKKIAKIFDTTIDFLVGLNSNPSPDEIVILEDSVEIKDGQENKKISPKVIRDFLKSLSDKDINE
ncbi:MAG: helix-turn-helix transcriptional regulator, partial [Clostridiales bacterium]